MAIKHIDVDNFQQLVINSEKTVLLDFWATWCGPCRMIAPVLEEIAKENPHILVGKVDVDEQHLLANEFQITSIPALIVVKNGVEVARSVGFKPKEQILELISK